MEVITHRAKWRASDGKYESWGLGAPKLRNCSSLKVASSLPAETFGEQAMKNHEHKGLGAPDLRDCS